MIFRDMFTVLPIQYFAAVLGIAAAYLLWMLIELIITIAVAMIVISAFPMARGALPEIRANSFSRSLAMDLREARSLAVQHGNDVIVTFDLSEKRVNIYSDSDLDGIEVSDLVRSRSFAEYGDGIAIRAVTTTGIDGSAISAAIKFGSTSNPIAVTFFPNGSAKNIGVVYLAPSATTNVNLGRAVEVLSSGKVSTWKYDINGSPGPWVKWI